MGNVINFEARKKEKAMKSLVDEVLKTGPNLNRKFIDDLLMNNHPITIKHKSQGRKLYGNVGKDQTFSVMASAKKAGFINIIVERTAIYAYRGAIHILPDCFSIYGKPMKK